MNNFPLSGGDDKNLSESLATRGARLKMSRFNFLTFSAIWTYKFENCFQPWLDIPV